MGWVTTVAYVVVSALCFAVARATVDERERPAGFRQTLWYAAAIVMGVLGINKQLDLQTPFVHMVRGVSMGGGWYSERRLIQKIFLVVLSVTGIATLSVAAWKLRWHWREYAPLCVGALLLLAYIVIRASPWPHVNTVFGFDLSGVAGKRHILELAGVSTVGLSAIAAFMRRTRQPNARS